jgi:AraC-like DNA-binding protein
VTASRETLDKITSSWPLPEDGVRFITPQFLLDVLVDHPLSRDLYPLAMGFYPRAVGHRMQRRHHNTHLLIYCTGGSGTLVVNDSARTVTAGDLLVLPPGTAHAYGADRAQPWSIYWVHYGGGESRAFTDFLLVEQQLRSIGVQPRLVAEFDTLLMVRRESLSVPRFIQGACRLKALLTEFGCAAAQSHRGPGKSIDMAQLLEHMRRHVDGNLDLESLAAMANLSRFHFIRRFRDATGHTPIQHFIHMKMARACELLDASGDPVKTVAAALGYTDPLYFSRQFRRVIGVSPQSYRGLHTT